MSKAIEDLLFTIRQHPAFRELVDAIPAPTVKPFRLSDDPDKHMAEHIFRSGEIRRHEAWRGLLIGEPTSQQEKS